MRNPGVAYWTREPVVTSHQLLRLTPIERADHDGLIAPGSREHAVQEMLSVGNSGEPTAASFGVLIIVWATPPADDTFQMPSSVPSSNRIVPSAYRLSYNLPRDELF